LTSAPEVLDSRVVALGPFVRKRLNACVWFACALGAVACTEEPIDTRRCIAPPGLGAPRTIDEAVALVNALPPPVTLPCYLESLDRPLALEASLSQFSAQPARGPGNPRMFLFSGALVSTIVPDGVGAALLEFGERIDDSRSVKGEIEFPVALPLDPAAPFERVQTSERGSTCGLCHAGEVPVGPTVPPRFVSRALRPLDEEIVDLDEVVDAFIACDPSMEPDRCEFLDALFLHGTIEHRSFPETVPTFR
jgi:hypothetical protein